MANRSQLAKTKLDEFSVWLFSRGWSEIKVRGEWEVARFYRDGCHLVIYDRSGSRPHYTVSLGIAEQELNEWFGQMGRGHAFQRRPGKR